MDTRRANDFADALQDLEKAGDVAGFVSATFSDDVELRRPETGQQDRGPDGARRFWQQYLDQFQQIRSEFTRVVDGEVAVLEWTSAGQLRTGSPVTYSGVSLLDFDDLGRVTRFATYYDTASFSAPAPPNPGT